MLDHFAAGATAVHRLDAAAKTVAALAVILATVLVQHGHFVPFFVIAVAVAAYHAVGRVPLRYTAKRLAIVSPLAVAIVVLFPILEPGRPVWSLGLGRWTLDVTDAGLARAGHLALKFLLAAWTALLLLATTRFQDLLDGLARLRIPRLFVTQLAFMYRYLWVLSDETMRLGQARAARDGGSGPWGLRFRSRAGVIGVLFVRTYDRAERIYWAMAARGFDGTLRTAAHSRLRPADWLFAAAAVLGSGLAVVWDRFAYG
jgi:cobalt/nickel transport system permease protein